MKRSELPMGGRGLYTVPEAERLTRVPARRIRRWMRGYAYQDGGAERWMPPVIAASSIGDSLAIDFGDLQEVRFLNAFREAGVGWRALCIAAEHAREVLGRPHPFSTQIFRADGRAVLAEIVDEAGDEVLLDLVRDQDAFERVLAPNLYAGMQFNASKEPEAWWPLGESRSVVVHPARSFGAPIVSRESIPTAVLWGAFKAKGTREFLARSFEVAQQSVSDAIEFEESLGT